MITSFEPDQLGQLEIDHPGPPDQIAGTRVPLCDFNQVPSFFSIEV